MKIVPLSEKDKYQYIAIEDFGDGTCRIYEPGEEGLLSSSFFMQVENGSVTHHQKSSRELSVSVEK